MADRTEAAVDHPAGPITFRPLRRDDFPTVRDWLVAPHVREWWRGDVPTPESVEDEYGPAVDRTDPTLVFVLQLSGAAIGLFQSYRHADNPEWDHAVGIPDAVGIDYLIGEAEHCGRGVGTASIAAFSALVFDLYPDHGLIVAVPQRDNRASCRALEKAGYTLSQERKLDTDDPSDYGVSAIYTLARQT